MNTSERRQHLEPLLITVEDAAYLLRISRAKAYQMASTGELPTVRFGRSVRVKRAALEQMFGL